MPRLTSSSLLAPLRRRLRRHRRPLAAALAAASVLLAVAALRAPAPADDAATPADPHALRSGEAAVPVELSSAGLAAALSPGDVIDLVRPDTGTAAARVRVLREVAAGLVAPGSAVVMVAVDAQRALGIAVSPEDGYAVVVHPEGQ